MLTFFLWYLGAFILFVAIPTFIVNVGVEHEEKYPKDDDLY